MLFAAASRGHVEVVKTLLEANANVNAIEVHGYEDSSLVSMSLSVC